MSFKWIFGKKKEPEVTTADSLAQLRNTESILMKKQELLEQKIEDQLKIAREHGTKDKRLALRALRAKKNHEAELTKLDGTLATLQGQINNLENAATNAEVLKVMGAGSKSLKTAYNNMDVDQIHDLMEDIAEQQEVADEIAQAISNPYGKNSVDDTDLLAELDVLEQEEIDRRLLSTNPKFADLDLPSVPTAELSKEYESDELAQLRDWAN